MKTSKLIILNLLASLLVGSIVVEVSFGQWFKPGIPMGHLNVLAGRTWFHNVQGLYSSESNIIRYVRDRYGLRGHYDGLGSIEIMTLGGSTTEQRYLGEGETWQDCLSRNFLNEGRSVDVVNAGVDGHSSVGHLRSFDLWFRRIPGLKVSYILLYIGINDLYTLGENDFDRGITKEGGYGGESIWGKSAILQMIRALTGWFRAAHTHDLAHRRIDFKKIQWTDKPIQKTPEAILNSYEADYRARLKLIDQEIRKMGAQPIWVTQTRAITKDDRGDVYANQAARRMAGNLINGVDEYRLIMAINRITMDECAKTDGICIDLGAEIDLPLEDYYDYYHLNPEGAQKVANYLYQKLRTTI